MAYAESPPLSNSPLVAKYGWLVCIFGSLHSPLMLLFRFYIGYQSFIAGKGHLMDFQKTVDYFTSLHIPMPAVNVAISGTTEMVGGILLFLGLASRVIAVPLVFNFAVAILSANLGDPDYHDKILHLWQGNNMNVLLNDTAFPFLIVSLLTLVYGPGKVSLDYLILRHLSGRKDVRV